jgi:hypothetical protein
MQITPATAPSHPAMPLSPHTRQPPCVAAQPAAHSPCWHASRPTLPLAPLAPTLPHAIPRVHPPLRSEARAKLDAAEQQGRAYDQKLALLTAARAYFAARQPQPEPPAAAART